MQCICTILCQCYMIVLCWGYNIDYNEEFPQMSFQTTTNYLMSYANSTSLTND